MRLDPHVFQTKAPLNINLQNNLVSIILMKLKLYYDSNVLCIKSDIKYFLL